MKIHESAYSNELKRRINFAEDEILGTLKEWILRLYTKDNENLIEQVLELCTNELLDKTGKNPRELPNDIWMKLYNYISKTYKDKITDYYNKTFSDDDTNTYCF